MDISPDTHSDGDTPEVGSKEGDTATKDASNLALTQIANSQSVAIEPNPGHESAREQSDEKSETVDKETPTPETPPREATPGSAPGREMEEQTTESHSASNQDPRPDSRSEESQVEILTKTKSHDWARIETLDHEAIRTAAMAKTDDSALGKADTTKKERGKNNTAGNPPAKEATHGLAPGSGTVEQAPRGSNRKFLTVDETGDVVNATWIDSPPTSEKYRKNQQLLREIRKDQDQIRYRKKSQKPGHTNAKQEEISGIVESETPTREATQGLAPDGEAESQPPNTQNRKPLKTLGDLSVDLSTVDLRKYKNLRPTLCKAIERQKAEGVTKGQGNKPPKERNTTTIAKPNEGIANKNRVFYSGKKTSVGKKIANQDLPKKLVKSKPLPPSVNFIGECESGGEDDNDDDDVQVIATQKTPIPELGPSGHKSAQKPQETKITKPTPSKSEEVQARLEPNAPKGPTEKRKPKRPIDPPEVVVIEAEGNTNSEDQRSERIKKT